MPDPFILLINLILAFIIVLDVQICRAIPAYEVIHMGISGKFYRFFTKHNHRPSESELTQCVQLSTYTNIIIITPISVCVPFLVEEQ